MRRISGGHLLMWLALALAMTLPAAAQQGTINPRVPPPPPPPPPEQPAPQPAPEPAAQPAALPKTPEAPTPPPTLPPTVTIPARTRIAVVLDTPLSTRIAHQGQQVTFRTSDPVRVHDLLEIPQETAFTGSVVEVKRPGHFGKPGVLRVKVDRISLATGTTAVVAARLDSPDMKGKGRLSSDNNRAADLANLALYSIEGTLIGAQVRGGKGAAVGAGAGAAVALLIMMSRKGSDVYLEPGMPFVVILDRPVELAGSQVYAAQQSYAQAHALDQGQNTSDTTETQRNADGTPADPDRPKLKRRPKKPQP